MCGDDEVTANYVLALDCGIRAYRRNGGGLL